MKQTKIILILSFIIFLSCKDKVSDKQIEKKDSIASVNAENSGNKRQEKSCDETFDEFFERFAKDSIFQKSRIKYPLKWYYLEDNESNELSFDVINGMDEYDYVDFTSDSQSDKYEVVYEKKKEEISYILKGNDSGLYMTYKFKIIDGCWYMIEILDEST